MSSSRLFYSVITSLSIVSILAGCGDKKADGQAASATPPPPEVSVVTVAPQKITLQNELPGRIEPVRTAEVRARVPGIVLKRIYEEGSDVKAGQALFRIDPAPYQATLNSAQAAIAKAEANVAQANLKLQRYKPLVESRAISQQEFDDAMTAQKQALADLETARANRETARLNLGYATVNAPISGRIGRALVTEGALVGQGEATQMALIQQMDPIYVTLTQSSSELLRLQQAMVSGNLKRVGQGQAKVTLVMEDGQAYPHSGKLLFSDLAVDPTTGSVTLRAEFPNPNRFLLPGMYARARLEQAVSENAIVIPQQALQRDPSGASVMLVGPDGKVKSQPVKVGQAQGNSWVVSEGLKAGDTLIVEGFQKVKPGAPVKGVPWQPAGNATGNASGNAPSQEGQPQGQAQATQLNTPPAKGPAKEQQPAQAK